MFIQPLSASDARTISSSSEFALGTQGKTADGRIYRYCQAGAVALSPGKLAVAATVVANHQNESVAAPAAVGVTSVTLTLGATAATANQYAGGFLTINDAAGEGISYLISSNPAADASASCVITLEEPIQVALTTSSEASLDKNPWDDIVIGTDQADMAVGIANVTITALYYGWVQTRGVCSALADETMAVGSALTVGSSVDGSLEVVDAAGEPQIGIALVAGVDTEYCAVYLQID